LASSRASRRIWVEKLDFSLGEGVAWDVILGVDGVLRGVFVRL
jgi:hypothetical protein